MSRDYHYLSRDIERLNNMAEDYKYLGRECKVVVNSVGSISELIVFAKPTNKLGRKDKNARTTERLEGQPGPHPDDESETKDATCVFMVKGRGAQAHQR
jgi:hypothetical protein